MRLKQVKIVVGDVADMSSLKPANVKLENKTFKFINLNNRAMISSLLVNSVFIFNNNKSREWLWIVPLGSFAMLGLAFASSGLSYDAYHYKIDVTRSEKAEKR